jgi:predicted amidohydrolase
MKNILKITIIQSELVWENSAQNRQVFLEKIKSISEVVDLIILPEMFTTGFTMNPEKVAETMDGETIHWLKYLAKEKNTAITGSLIIKEGNKYYNRLVFVHPTGEIKTYDKRHTFTLAGEDKIYTAGNKKLIVAYKGWRICPMICYDLRFPVWSRNTDDYNLLIYVANWPKPRITAWSTLLKARAIENMSYVVGVNRIGADDNGHEYSGNSAAYNALGSEISTIEPNKNTTEIISISMDELTKTRNKFGFLEDRDKFKMMNEE